MWTGDPNGNAQSMSVKVKGRTAWLSPLYGNNWIPNEGYVRTPHTFIVELSTDAHESTCCACRHVAQPGEVMGIYWRSGCCKHFVCQTCMDTYISN